MEGRNGRLALLQHGSRFLGTKRRRALTILHDLAIHRPDDSTPASRFFRQPHRDLVAFLLDHLNLPPPTQTLRLSRLRPHQGVGELVKGAKGPPKDMAGSREYGPLPSNTIGHIHQ